MAQIRLPEGLDRLAQIQAGVLTRSQAVEGGLSAGAVDWLAGTGRWPVLQRGVYSIYTGQPGRDSVLWAAVLQAGPGAALSFGSAAEVYRRTDVPGPRIHVTIPRERTVAPVRGLVVHRSGRLIEATQPTDLPPRTRVEDTVLDLAGQASSFDAAFAIVCAAVQRRLTMPGWIRRAMDVRRKLRWRNELTRALAEIGSGVHSQLHMIMDYSCARRPPGQRKQRVVHIWGAVCISAWPVYIGHCTVLTMPRAWPDPYSHGCRWNAPAGKGPS